MESVGGILVGYGVGEREWRDNGEVEAWNPQPP